MSSLISGLAGAGGAANTAGGYYTGAANDIYNAYGPSATSNFVRLQNQALRPQMDEAAQQLSATQAAQGLSKSGAGRANYGTVGANDASSLASADAPLFSQGLGAAAGTLSQMPGAQNQAYQNAIQQFYQAIGSAGSLAGDIMGMPSGGGGGGSAADTPGGMGSYSNGSYYTQSGVPYLT